MAMMVFASCSNEDEINPSIEQGQTYMQVSVQLPTGATTKSSTNNDGTSTDGTEVGQDYENNVTSLQVVLVAEGTTTPICVTASTGGVTETGKYTTNPFPVSTLTASTKYNVYVIVNSITPITSLDEAYELNVLNGTDLTKSVASPNAFLMTGTGVESVTTGQDLTGYTKDNPFNAGSVKVERSVARFDYKQGVEGDKHEINGGKDIITLVGADLINVSNTFHYFKRVSPDGTATDAVIGGVETSSNYVVDHNVANKAIGNIANWGDYYFNWMATAGTGGNYTDLADFKDEYSIWKYCSENTIAGASNQLNGITTGVVFKAELTGENFEGQTGNVYVYNNKVIGSWAQVWSSDDVDVKNALANNSDLKETESENSVDDLEKANFTSFKNDAGKYYAYYIYWNRHNDNNISSVMGPMEFAVVRNNVYKLAVTSISGFGHPNDPINPGPNPTPDPNKPNPSDPDEDSNMYMTVEVQILPWTVRINNIEF